MCEKRYTLPQAEAELARRECALHGHDYEFMERDLGEPVGVTCTRCARSWTVLTPEQLAGEIKAAVDAALTADP